MIALFTAFGLNGPYVGQMHAVLAQEAPGVPVIDLFHDVPPHDVRAAAYLLPAYAAYFPADTVFVCVVDPGVGGPRRPVLLQTGQHWYVGPDNGLLELVSRRARPAHCRVITWQPTRLSASFHGRDLFAPVAALLARGVQPPGQADTLDPVASDWPDDLPEVVYIDRFGNLLTGLRATALAGTAVLRAAGRALQRATTFSEVAAGEPFWYENSNGLVEIAVNEGSAAEFLRMKVGDAVETP